MQTVPPAASTLYQTLQERLSGIWPAIALISKTAEQQGWAAYLVGGAVRDLLLDFIPSFKGERQALVDIDIVVEGAEPGAGVALAQALQARYPQVLVQIYGQFQTAALVWPSKTDLTKTGASSSIEVAPSSSPLSIDIATARTEFYPYPAANPEVKASSIEQDLYRRDFTINAMAICLTQGGDLPVGTLLDEFDGWTDLQQQQVRVLHRQSFIDDPTRIFRAVRFAVRLGFSINTQTEQLIRTAVDSGIYAQMRTDLRKTPALQSRLKAELAYLLQTKIWEASLKEVTRLGAWVCLDSDLDMTPLLWQQLRRMDRWLARFGASFDSQPRWLMLLELLLLQLPPGRAASVANYLNLGAASQRRLENLPLWEANLLEQLALSQRPSHIYSLLKQYDMCELLLMSDRHPYTLGSPIWQYIVRLSQVASPISGATLKRLGLQPGPQFREILARVHHLTLDGELTTAQAAEQYVLTHYLAD